MAERALGVDWLGAITIAREREKLPPGGRYTKGFAVLLIFQSPSTVIRAWRVDVGPSASILGFGARRPSIALTSGQLNLIVFRLTFG